MSDNDILAQRSACDDVLSDVLTDVFSEVTEYVPDRFPIRGHLTRPLTLAVTAEGDAHITPRQLAVEQVTPAAAALSRLIGRGLTVALPALKARLQLHLSPADAMAWRDPVTMQGPAGALAIADGARCLRALTGVDLDALPPREHRARAWFLAAAASRLSSTPLAAMDRIVDAAPQMAQSAITLRFSLLGLDHNLSTIARADAATWMHLLSNTCWEKQGLPLDDWLRISTMHTVCMARHSLPSAALRRLAPGDIVLPDHPRFCCDGSGVLGLAGKQWQVRYRSPGSLEIIAMEMTLDAEAQENIDQPPEPDDLSMAQDPTPDANHTAAQDSIAADALDALPLTLIFELGRIAISLGDLRTLGPRSVLNLQQGSTASIKVVCAGRVLGRGEAVDVDGALGIRITHWGKS